MSSGEHFYHGQYYDGFGHQESSCRYCSAEKASGLTAKDAEILRLRKKLTSSEKLRNANYHRFMDAKAQLAQLQAAVRVKDEALREIYDRSSGHWEKSIAIAALSTAAPTTEEP